MEGRLSGGHARTIAGAEEAKHQSELAKLACDGKMSVRELEKLIAAAPKKQKPRRAERTKDPEVTNIENQLKELLGTKVNINTKGKKGKIEISFFSLDDLERILSTLKQIEDI